MPPNSTAVGRAAIAALVLIAGAERAAQSAPDGAADLDGVRQQCIAAARQTQQQEGAVTALEHRIELLGRDAAGRQRGLDESRREQEDLLGVIERIQRTPPERAAFAFTDPLERQRSDLLITAMAPALCAEAHALAAEIERITALHREIAARQRDLAAAEDALAKDRQGLSSLAAARLDLTQKLLPPDPGADTRVAALARDAKDVGDLIKRADAATERRDKDILTRARAALPKADAAKLTAAIADPTAPRLFHAFDPPQSALLPPVSGPVSRRFGAADAGQEPAQGVVFAASPGGEVVAPFDGRVIYAGPFRNLGLVLIIRHGGGYHSVLTGLGRTDTRVDQWLLAGEPVGALPQTSPEPAAGAAEGNVAAAGGVLYLELRHDGRPVDPQPWLAMRDDGHPGEPPGASDAQNGDQRVRE